MFIHPLLIVTSLILQRFTLIAIFYFLNFNLWNAYMLFLIFLGGLLIIFVYLSALIPNEIFQKKTSRLTLFMLISLCFFLLESKFEAFYFYESLNTPEIYVPLFLTSSLPIIITYLLVTLFRTIILCSKRKTPLKINSYDTTKKITYTKNFKFLSSRSTCPEKHYPLLKFRIPTRHLPCNSNFNWNFFSHTL